MRATSAPKRSNPGLEITKCAWAEKQSSMQRYQGRGPPHPWPISRRQSYTTPAAWSPRSTHTVFDCAWKESATAGRWTRSSPLRTRGVQMQAHRIAWDTCRIQCCGGYSGIFRPGSCASEALRPTGFSTSLSRHHLCQPGSSEATGRCRSVTLQQPKSW